MVSSPVKVLYTQLAAQVFHIYSKNNVFFTRR